MFHIQRLWLTFLFSNLTILAACVLHHFQGIRKTPSMDFVLNWKNFLFQDIFFSWNLLKRIVLFFQLFGWEVKTWFINANQYLTRTTGLEGRIRKRPVGGQGGWSPLRKEGLRGWNHLTQKHQLQYSHQFQYFFLERGEFFPIENYSRGEFFFGTRYFPRGNRGNFSFQVGLIQEEVIQRWVLLGGLMCNPILRPWQNHILH